ncbi:hypothetical protein [Pseudomonas protegens]|uniref:hypothetical protein n=1 Tax=Pseudomonas protegens TaxID=380021 RepID=UPI00215F65C2|nr:hypothetical protein [Pseudomonas protegens]UVL70588.1 hypothetical protein LOY23_21375 [Pseudomonas protegens]
MSNQGFELLMPSGEVAISSQWPALNMSQYQRGISVVMIDQYNAEGRLMYPEKRRTCPIVAFMPRTIGLHIDLGGYVSGPLSDRYYTGTSFKGRSWNWQPATGIVDAYLFEFYSINSGSKFGLQSFNEAGELVFDSESASMRILKIIRPEDLSYDGYGDTPGWVGNPGWRTYFYSAPWPEGGQAFVIMSEGQQTSGGSGAAGFWGFRTSFDRVSFSYTWAKDSPPGGFVPGQIAVVAITKKLA